MRIECVRLCLFIFFCVTHMVHDDVCMFYLHFDKTKKNPVIRGDNSNERHKSIENDESR